MSDMISAEEFNAMQKKGSDRQYVSPVKVTEKQFMKLVIDLGTAYGWRFYHEATSFGSKPGKPDLELSHEQHGIVFLELKVGNRQPTEAQQDWLDWYHTCGIPAYLVRPSDMDFLEAFFRGEATDTERKRAS